MGRGILGLIDDMTIHKGYGSWRMADYLNRKGIKTHTGGSFTSIKINRMLKDPFYCGRLGGTVLFKLFDYIPYSNVNSHLSRDFCPILHCFSLTGGSPPAEKCLLWNKNPVKSCHFRLCEHALARGKIFKPIWVLRFNQRFLRKKSIVSLCKRFKYF